MRLAVVVPEFPVVSETFIAAEVMRLRRRGFDVQAICFGSEASADPVQLANLRRTGVPVRYLGDRKQLSLIWPAFAGMAAALPAGLAIARLNRHWPIGAASRAARLLRALALLHIVRSEHIDLLHCHWTLASDTAYLLHQAAGIRFSISAHAVDIYDDAAPTEEGRRALARKIDAAAFVTTCTAQNERFLHRLAPTAAGKVHLAYHGIDLDRFDGRREPRAGVPLILSVGRLLPKKGFATLIALMTQIRDRGIAARCVIVGDGPQRRQLEAMIERNALEGVTLTGAQTHERVTGWLRMADLFVLCPEAERGHYGIPNVLFEAMAMRVPVVVRRLPAIEELIEDGTNGFIVDDERELLDTMEALLRSPARRAEVAECGRTTILDRFDAERTIDVVVRAIERTG
jgi:glycosyltransferase involved in cell wall biosynthesis